MVRCAVVLGRSLVHVYECQEPEVMIGRDVDQHIRIDNDAVSRHHALLLFSGGSWTIQDLATSNGTQLNGRPVDFAPVKPGDAIQVGKHTILFDPSQEQLRLLEPARPVLGQGQKPASTVFMDSDDMAAVIRRVEDERAAHLRLVAPAGRDKRWTLQKEETVLGSAVDADVVLTGWFVARQHAVIARDRQGFRLTWLAGLRPVHVNGRPVRETRLKHHDEIRIGKSRFQFFDAL
jgi:pSer/pThr/pTyr-binding forkhead associated (FHA) protein